VLTADQIVTMLGLRPLPEEGGEYVETWHAPAVVASREGDSANRPLGTAIYYLLRPDTFSTIHRLGTDELFHFYLGDPVEQLQLAPDGSGQLVTIGPDLAAGMRPQVVVPGEYWQGARLGQEVRYGYALLGTTMAPGFDLADFETGSRADLAAAYPAWSALIAALTPDGD
jgi:predicted cupin superfamily sugar epimerase